MHHMQAGGTQFILSHSWNDAAPVLRNITLTENTYTIQSAPAGICTTKCRALLYCMLPCKWMHSSQDKHSPGIIRSSGLNCKSMFSSSIFDPLSMTIRNTATAMRKKWSTFPTPIHPSSNPIITFTRTSLQHTFYGRWANMLAVSTYNIRTLSSNVHSYLTVISSHRLHSSHLNQDLYLLGSLTQLGIWVPNLISKHHLTVWFSR